MEVMAELGVPLRDLSVVSCGFAREGDSAGLDLRDVRGRDGVGWRRGEVNQGGSVHVGHCWQGLFGL